MALSELRRCLTPFLLPLLTPASGPLGGLTALPAELPLPHRKVTHSNSVLVSASQSTQPVWWHSRVEML